jgi:ribosome biogenesis GTPase
VRQKDKKRNIRYRGRLRNISLPDVDILDSEPEFTDYKTERKDSKRDNIYKSDAVLKEGRVMEIMSNYNCSVQLADELISASISGRLKQFKSRATGILAVGDYVQVDVSQKPDYRVENILPRTNSLIRYSGGTFQKEIPLAANIDRLIITVSWRKPIFKAGLIDRYLILANLHKVKPILVMNKVDLCEYREDIDEELSQYRQLGIKTILTSAVTQEGIDELKDELKGKDSVFSGHSGAGKSSLINVLMPGLELLTAPVSEYNEKGKHTTTQAVMIPWDFSGHLIDTPGIKTINLHRDLKELLPKLFPGFDRLYPKCKFRDCSHIHEEGCAVIAAVENDELHIERYDSYLWILDNI